LNLSEESSAKESVDELALKIEPLMYYTGEGAGNDMRECPDGNRNANIS